MPGSNDPFRAAQQRRLEQQRQRFARQNRERAAKQMNELMAKTRSERKSRRQQRALLEQQEERQRQRVAPAERGVPSFADRSGVAQHPPSEPILEIAAHGRRDLGLRAVLPAGSETLVGRTKAAGVLIDDVGVSRRHARLVHDERGVVLADLGSANGTWVNGQRITSPALLRDGDKVSFGGVSAVFWASGSAPRQRERVSAADAHDGAGARSGLVTAETPVRPPGGPRATEAGFARQLVSAKDYIGAIRVLEPHVQRHPDDVEAWNLLGLASFESALYPAAESVYRRMLDQAPNDFRAMYGLGTTLQRLGRLDEAERWLRATLAANPGFARATQRLGELQTARAQGPGPAGQGHPSQPQEPPGTHTVPENDRSGLVTAETPVRPPGGPRATEAGFARQLVSAKDYIGAIRVLEPHVQRHPDDVEAWNLLGLASFESALYPAAESVYRRMLDQAPNDFRAMYGLGTTLQRLGRVDEAERWLRATLAANPGFARATQRLGEHFDRLEERSTLRRQIFETTNSLSVSGHPFHPLGSIRVVVSRVLETLGIEGESQPIS